MSSDDDVDYSEIQSALGSIGLSAALIFGATLLSQGIGFATRITMARYLPVSGYGNIAVGISLLNLLGIVVLIGMPRALSRFIPRGNSSNEQRETISSAFQIIGTLGFLISVITYFAASPLSRLVFDNESLIWIIRIFASAIPFYAFYRLSIGGFRGYERTLPWVLSEKILRPGLQLIGIVIFVWLGYGTTGITFAYAVVFVILGFVSTSVLYHISGMSFRELFTLNQRSRYNKLVEFSLPLAVSSGIGIIAKHSDILLLSIFKSSSITGIYDVSFRMSMFILFLVTPAIGYLYEPLMSKFDSNQNIEKMEKLYVVTTRWIVVLTFPIFVMLTLFPRQTLNFFFGSKYDGGATALSILAIGFMITRVPGLTQNFLAAKGRTKTIMYVSFGVAVLNIIINLALIPIYGLIGAAIATATARIAGVCMESFVLFRDYNVHPFVREFTFPLAITLFTLLSLYIFLIEPITIAFFEGLLISSGLGIFYIVLIILTNSVYTVEIKLFNAFLEWCGLNVSTKGNNE